MNADHFRTRERFQDLWKFSYEPDGNGDLFHPWGTDITAASVLTHEFGHHLDYWLRAQNKAYLPLFSNDGMGIVGESWLELIRSYRPTAALSRYATMRSASGDPWTESVAEALSAIRWGRGAKTAFQQRIEAFLAILGDSANWLDIDEAFELRDLPQNHPARNAITAKISALTRFIFGDDAAEWEDRWRDGARSWLEDITARRGRNNRRGVQRSISEQLRREDTILSGHTKDLSEFRKRRRGG